MTAVIDAQVFHHHNYMASSNQDSPHILHPDETPYHPTDWPTQTGENLTNPNDMEGRQHEISQNLQDDRSLEQKYSEYKNSGEGLDSSASMTENGRIQISLGLKIPKLPHFSSTHAVKVNEFAIDPIGFTTAPPLNVIIMLVGSRGDVQPYLALGQTLQQHGHRVRIATHPSFGDFVKEHGIEFFSIGGDPQDLMSYMVRNPGLIPGIQSLKNGDIPRKRKMLKEMLDGCWRACYEPDEESGRAFAADAIISNPPAFAHIHCAEALGIPLQMSFTMPWCATTSFPHPLVNIQQTNTEKNLTNYLSYALADIMQWQGLGDVINQFRKKSLGLAELSSRSGASVVDRLKIPWTYCFSPSLIPKPDDWMNHIDVVGFYFLNSSSSYQPPEDLAKFLDEGDPPIYIGFGSVVVDDAAEMTRTIFGAVQLTGARAIVSAGWGGLGGTDVPSNIYILPSKPGVPHDWLFARVSAVCHHGGAGTTAIGVFLGKPTMIVPFFGDQPFWGAMVYHAGAGPAPIEHKKLNSKNLADGLKFCLTDGAKRNAEIMGKKIRAEKGIQKGVDSFHAHLPLLNMRCDLEPSRTAVWWSGKHLLKLSAFAAQVLASAGHLDIDSLDCHRPREYDTRAETSDPVTGGVGAVFWTISECTSGLAQICVKPKEGVINAGTAIPKGVSKVIWSIQEGLYNVPKMFGSDIRRQGEITDWRSGIKEGGRAFGYGWYDGISSLVAEPYRGVKQEGIKGGIKGVVRGIVNVQVQPAAANLAIATHPARGIWMSAHRRWAKTRKQNLQIRNTRKLEGSEAFENSAQKQREGVLEAFRNSQNTFDERRDVIRRALSENVWKKGDHSKSPSGSGAANAPQAPARTVLRGGGLSALTSAAAHGMPLPLAVPPVAKLLGPRPPLPPNQTSAQGTPSAAIGKRPLTADQDAEDISDDSDGNEVGDFDEAAFQRDLATAIKLSQQEREPQAAGSLWGSSEGTVGALNSR